MAGSTFKTNPYDLHELLKNCDRGFTSTTRFSAELGVG
jgi:hypothetical protein